MTRDETGGRVVGHFSVNGGTLVLRVTAVIEPGPNARTHEYELLSGRRLPD